MAEAKSHKSEPGTKEECDVLPDDLLRAIARLKGRAEPQKGVPVPVSILYPVSAAIAAEERRKKAEALANLVPGQVIPGEGVYLCKYAPQDRDGRSLGKEFNVFAAKEDLTDDHNNRAMRTYPDTVEHLSKLKNWHDHDGAGYKNDTELYAALEDGSYNGEWVIPTRELLSGNNIDGEDVQSDNLVRHIKAGELKNTFSNVDYDCPEDWYWSCTEKFHGAGDVMHVRLADGSHFYVPDYIDSSCRPVRLVPVP